MKRYRDCEGDTWTEQSEGEFKLTEVADQRRQLNQGSTGSLPFVREWWGPLTELDPEPADLSAPATRGDIVRVLEAIYALATRTSEEVADEVGAMITAIEEGRA